MEGRTRERGMEAQIEEVAWGREEGFHVLFQIMMYSEASIGLQGQSPVGLSSLEARECLGV